MNERNLVEKIAAFIERFVFIEYKPTYRLLALWVIQTHLYKEFEYTGYIFAYSPEPGSGKSRLLEVLDLFVANSSSPLIKPTDAIIFRTAAGTTQLFDEVDTWTNGDFLRGILNAGFHCSGVVQRCEQDEKGKWNTVAFPVYAPRAMAGIGLKILGGTTKDRTFIIPMVRRTHAERGEKFRLRRVKPEANQIKAEIEAWVNRSRSPIAALYDDAETAFPYLWHLRERTIDIVEPLAAILEVAHAEAPDLDARRTELLEAVNLTRNDGKEFLAEHRILRELLRLAEAEDPLVGNGSELAAKCKLNLQLTEYQISGTLRRYRFESRSVRLGQSVRYRYELPRARLAEICARHLQSEESSSCSRFQEGEGEQMGENRKECSNCSRLQRRKSEQGAGHSSAPHTPLEPTTPTTSTSSFLLPNGNVNLGDPRFYGLNSWNDMPLTASQS